MKRLNMITIFLYACISPYNSVLPWKSLQTDRGSSQALDNSYRIRIPRTRYAMLKGYGDEPTISEKCCKVSEHRTFLYNKPVLLNALTRENCVGTGVAGIDKCIWSTLLPSSFGIKKKPSNNKKKITKMFTWRKLGRREDRRQEN